MHPSGRRVPIGRAGQLNESEWWSVASAVPALDDKRLKGLEPSTFCMAIAVLDLELR